MMMSRLARRGVVHANRLHSSSGVSFRVDASVSPFRLFRSSSSSPMSPSPSSAQPLASDVDHAATRKQTKPSQTTQKASLQRQVDIPTEANIVIIGGGVIGCSVAYHLAKLGAKNVYLLEKNELTHGCTWHAAGLLGQLRGTKNLTRMLQYSAECFGELQRDTGIDPEWRPVGSIRVAASMERWKELKRSSSQAASFGFGMELISPSDARRLCPVLDTSDLLGAAWIPTDGHIEPTSLTNAFAKGARDRGVKILQGVQVVGIKSKSTGGNLFSPPRVTTLRVNSKHADDPNKVYDINITGSVVNCAGLWARRLGLLLGTNVPTINVQHQYLVTEPITGEDAIPKNLPSFRDPDALLYYKPEQGGLVVGGWEDNTIAVDVPDEFGPQLYEGNMERFEPLAINAAKRTPVLNQTGVRKLVNGPIPISPDGEPIMGLCSEYSNLYVAAGFTAGIGASGGAGRMMAEWVLGGEPSMDLWPLDIRRFHPSIHKAKSYLEMRGVEAYGGYYKLHYPGKESHAGRPMRVSSIYDRLRAQGARFGSKFGWERAMYFARSESGGVAPTDSAQPNPSFNRRQDRDPDACSEWDCVRREHHAARSKVIAVDQSSFGKLEVYGPGASNFLSRLVNNDILTGGADSVYYTQLLNARGGIECDVTIARVDENKFYVMTGSGFATRDFGWIRSNLAANQYDHVTINEVTTQYGVINIAGPNSRKLLVSAGVEEDVSNDTFPFMTCRTIHIANVSIRALRVTFVGELGYELHMPMECMPAVYDALFAAGDRDSSIGLVPGGYRVLESLRLEKGYRVWGADITPQVTPLEAGLGFCCKMEKQGGFIGLEAIQAMKAGGGPKRKLACFTVDRDDDLTNDSFGFVDRDADTALDIRPTDPLFLSGNESIVYRGTVVGYSTSAGFGYSIGRHIIYGFIPAEIADEKEGEFHIHAYGKLIRITKQPMNKALYDHKREKILA